MDGSSINNDQEKASARGPSKEGKNGSVDPQVNPEEKNGISPGLRLTEEMLEYYYRQSKEYERYKRKYEEAAYRVYGTIPSGVDPQEFRVRMEELQKQRASKQGEDISGWNSAMVGGIYHGT